MTGKQVILGSVCNATGFTYEQLDEATKRFNREKATVNVVDGTVRAGVLDDGSVVAVQRIGYATQENLRLVLDRVELLSEVPHRNMARVVGFCLDSRNALLLVHEHFDGGTLEDHLRQMRGRVLSWYHRVNIAIELASALTYLQAHEVGSTFLHDLKSSEILLDADFTAKIAGSKLARPVTYAALYDQDVVCNSGHLLVELLTGLRHQHPFDSVAPKVREERLHEVIDPTLLFFGKQLPASNEVRKVFELAVRCLLSVENGMCMLGVAKELMQCTL